MRTGALGIATPSIFIFGGILVSADVCASHKIKNHRSFATINSIGNRSETVEAYLLGANVGGSGFVYPSPSSRSVSAVESLPVPRFTNSPARDPTPGSSHRLRSRAAPSDVSISN